jgi:hypothetical protein
MHERRDGRRVIRRSASSKAALDESGEQAERAKAVTELAAYIAQLASEMAKLADEARLDVLAYLLSMAVSEATALARAAPKRSADD